MTSQLDAREFIAGYLAEADEYLTAAQQRLLELEQSVRRGESNPRAVRELFRAVHTIKGLSAMVGVDPVVDLAHELETYLRAADRAGGFSTPEAVDLLIQGVREVEARVRAVAHQKPVEPAPQGMLAALHALGEGVRPPPARPGMEIKLPPELMSRLSASEREQLLRGVSRDLRAVRVDFAPSAARAGEGITIAAARKRIEALAEIVKILPIAVPSPDGERSGVRFALFVLTKADDAAVAEAVFAEPGSVEPLVVEVAPAAGTGIGVPASAGAAAGEPLSPEELETDDRSYIRVEVARLDDAMERLSALIVTRFRMVRALSTLAQRGVDTRELAGILGDAGRQLRDLRGSIMRARMVPVTELLARLPLLVRSLSRTVGKSARVELHTGRAELDKAVADRIFPALVHLVRNAVDHGLELPAERRAQGKPEEGVVLVRCTPRSDNQLELAISDDGRGVDAAQVAARAGAPVPATPAQLLELLCRPGLSTMEAASRVSGRGMGMDIVRRIAVEQLGGDLALSTGPGQGTTFTVHLPLRLTIVDAFTFTCGQEPFVVPVSMVEEIVEVDPGKLHRAPQPSSLQASSGLFERRGEAVPLLPLSRLFGISGAGEGRKALIVRRGGAPFAFGVDRLVGQQEVVVRPLEDPLVRVTGVTGSTDLGDGRPTLVLDLVALSASV